MPVTLDSVFGSRPVVLPVIHVESAEQALRNARLARDAGADGVFLINHGLGDAELLVIHARVAAVLPGFWVGVNCLGLEPEEAVARLGPEVAGLWVDNAGIDERRAEQPEAERFAAAREARGWRGLYFGGVAFKYQRTVDDLTAAARVAARHIDVVTTSGPGTGEAASVSKIRAMKEAMGPTPLAIASGITPGNVESYLPWADCFLVATGISRGFEELDAGLTRELVERVRAWRGGPGGGSDADDRAARARARRRGG